MNKKLLLILSLFDKYFLFLMLIQGFTLSIYDYAKFKRDGEVVVAKKAKHFGYIAIFLSLALYIFKTVIH